MTLYAPSYYPSFSCIADKCKHSCCIGWEIDVDPDTLRAYRDCNHPYGQNIRDSISYDSDPHFRLSEGEKCPHLNGEGLCNIILQLGEGSLCEICREHPRFYHDTVRGREVGLGMACEEACRLILSREDYHTFVPLGNTEETEPVFFDTLPHREQLYTLLSNQGVPSARRLREISHAYGVTPSCRSDSQWNTLLQELEYLDGQHRDLFSCYSSAACVPPRREQAMERILAYLIFRHCTPAWCEEDFRASLGFCLFCHQLLISVLCAHPDSPIADAARILSEELEYSTDNTDTIKSMF